MKAEDGPLIYQEQAVTREIASRFRGQVFVSQWIEYAQVVVSATLVYRNHAIASEFASQMLVWETAVARNKAIAMEV
jgi:hypothetical protein